MTPIIKRDDLIYPELSYKISGILFEVYNELGPGLSEKHYQRAIALALTKNGYKYKEQVFIPIKFQGQKVGSYFLDFLIEDKIVLEIKRGEFFRKSNINQVHEYLIATNLALGLLANFTNSDVKIKRILNIYPKNYNSYISTNSP